MATKIEYTPMRIIQTSKENAEKLLAGESITTAEGEVITFGMNDILVTPDDTVAKVSGLDNRVTALENATPPEIDTSKFVTTNTEQEITGIKTFTDDVYFEFGAIFSGTLYSDRDDGYITTENNGLYISLADGIMYAYSPDKDTFYKGHGIDIDWLDKSENTHSYSLNFPEKESGTYTLATTDDCKKLYRHEVVFRTDWYGTDSIILSFISSKATSVTSWNEIPHGYHTAVVTGDFAGAVSAYMSEVELYISGAVSDYDDNGVVMFDGVIDDGGDYKIADTVTVL